jgi:hypothetical protein
MNQLAYHEAVRAAVEQTSNGGKKPLVIPAGLVLLNVKKAMASGRLSGFGEFFATVFSDGGADIHVSAVGAYMVNMTFFACMFASNPVGKLDGWNGAGTDPPSLTSAQKSIIEQIVWETVSAYKYSGIPH